MDRPYFSNDDLSSIDSYYKRFHKQLAKEGFSFEDDDDPDALKAFWHDRGIASELPFHSMYDSKRADLTKRTFWWAKMLDETGEIYGVAAQRLFEMPNFLPAAANYELFFDRLELDWRPLEIHPECPDLSGAIVVGGAFWIAPEFRKKGIPNILSEMIHAHSLRAFRPDYKAAIYADNETGHKRAYRQGYRRTAKFLSGPYPPHDYAHRELIIAWQTRSEMLERMKGVLQAAAE